MEKKVLVNIEIPSGSKIKYEYDRVSKKIVVDRILREGFTYPANYGSLEETLDWDGDELDVLIYSPEKFLPGTLVAGYIVGAMKMIDDGETDTKLIVVHADDYRLNHVQNLSDIPNDWLNKNKEFFSTYKNWKRKDITQVSGFKDKEWAIKEYYECVNLMNKYGNIKKNDFIIEMKKLHPEKYI